MQTKRMTELARRLLGSRGLSALPWMVFFAGFVLFQVQYSRLPPYWDGTVNFIAAFSIQENHMSPFLPRGDTGHPPLWAWLLAAWGQLGAPMILGFHLISWACAATLLEATRRLGRKAGGETAGWVSALLVGINPCVAGQALQFNLDLPMAAMGVMALALFAEGRLWRAGVFASLMTLSKLNGAFGLAPIFAMSAGLLIFDARFRRPQALAGLAGMNLLPLASLAAYFAAKRIALGRFLDSGEFESGNQVALARTFRALADNIFHSCHQFLANGGMWFFFCALLMVGAIRWALRSQGLPPSAAAPRPPGQDARNGESKLSLSAKSVFALLALMAAAQVLAQSIRSIATLPRYFMIAYPSLVIPVVGGIAASFGRTRMIALASAVLVLGGVQAVKWHPDHWGEMHASLRMIFSNPAKETPTNHEWSLGFVDVLRHTRKLAERLENDIRPGENVGGQWPFTLYLTDPRFGFVKHPHPLAASNGLEWWKNATQADYLIIYNYQPRHVPLPYGYPGAKGIRLVKYRTSSTGSLSLFRWRPELD